MSVITMSSISAYCILAHLPHSTLLTHYLWTKMKSRSSSNYIFLHILIYILLAFRNPSSPLPIPVFRPKLCRSSKRDPAVWSTSQRYTSSIYFSIPSVYFTDSSPWPRNRIWYLVSIHHVFWHSILTINIAHQPAYRAIDIADEFPRAEVIAIDLAPIQPQFVLLPNNDPYLNWHAPSQGMFLLIARKT